jgi:hypothetical protein
LQRVLFVFHMSFWSNLISFLYLMLWLSSLAPQIKIDGVVTHKSKLDFWMCIYYFWILSEAKCVSHSECAFLTSNDVYFIKSLFLAWSRVFDLTKISSKIFPCISPHIVSLSDTNAMLRLLKARTLPTKLLIYVSNLSFINRAILCYYVNLSFSLILSELKQEFLTAVWIHLREEKLQRLPLVLT